MYPSTVPTYEEVCSGFAFPVPHSYYKLLQLAFELSPRNPWNAFDPFDFTGLGNTHANPHYVYPGHDTASTPVEIYVIGWTGTDGGHYGFLVDDLPTKSQELPIVEVYPLDGECRLLGMNVTEFLSVRIGESVRDYGEQWYKEHYELISRLVCELDVNISRSIDEILTNAILERAQAGCIFTTIDRCGTKVPMQLVDWEFWTRIDWDVVRREDEMPMHLLNEAGSRMGKGDYATAFLIAKNLWMLYWQRTPSGDAREWIRRTGDVMQQAYRILERKHLEEKMRSVIEWILQEVV